MYSALLRGEEGFERFFRAATPVSELAGMNLGSRPAVRGAAKASSGGNGLVGLRAIPWVFAWTQIRLMLPAWLGTGTAINQVHEQHKNTLNDMLDQWPYFQTLIDMLEMVLSKSDADIALYYESHLTDDQDLKALGIENLDELMENMEENEKILEDMETPWEEKL
jgi:phosphoenolpyruvate carboxylase